MCVYVFLSMCVPLPIYHQLSWAASWLTLAPWSLASSCSVGKSAGGSCNHQKNQDRKNPISHILTLLISIQKTPGQNPP